jgi:hypothetical protein
MQDSAYDEVLRYVQNWSLDEQLKLTSDLLASMRQQVDTEPRHKAREFRGVGQKTWKDVDVGKYIEEERSSWNG